MDDRPIDLGDVLRNVVESLFPGAPIVFSVPICEETLDVAEIGAPGPPGARQHLIRQANAVQPAAQILEVFVGDLNFHSLKSGPRVVNRD